jgi:uncharacterized low-complexity protein
MKKLLLSALIVVSTLTCIAPANALSPKSTNQSSISKENQVAQAKLADRGKPGNPIPAGRR